MNIHEKIKMEEGDKALAYQCPAGKWTIGAGIKLEQQPMPQDLRDIWLERIIMDNWIKVNDRLVSEYNFGFIDLGSDVPTVLQDMAYQLGVSGLFQFKKMLSAIAEKDYRRAANELLDSKYARQTPNRANRNAELLRGCE